MSGLHLQESIDQESAGRWRMAARCGLLRCIGGYWGRKFLPQRHRGQRRQFEIGDLRFEIKRVGLDGRSGRHGRTGRSGPAWTERTKWTAWTDRTKWSHG